MQVYPFYFVLPFYFPMTLSSFHLSFLCPLAAQFRHYLTSSVFSSVSGAFSIVAFSPSRWHYSGFFLLLLVCFPISLSLGSPQPAALSRGKKKVSLFRQDVITEVEVKGGISKHQRTPPLTHYGRSTCFSLLFRFILFNLPLKLLMKQECLYVFQMVVPTPIAL